jgi:hypothetical protein
MSGLLLTIGVAVCTCCCHHVAQPYRQDLMRLILVRSQAGVCVSHLPLFHGIYYYYYHHHHL